jgi:ABC-type phosphate transport system substrate-binding protein
MSRKILVYFLAVTTLCLTVCGDAFSETDNLKTAGCKTEIYLLKDIAEAYKEQTGKTLRLGNTGNKKAVNLLLEKKVDFTSSWQAERPMCPSQFWDLTSGHCRCVMDYRLTCVFAQLTCVDF